MTPVLGKPVPSNLSNGLDKLVTNNLIQEGKITSVPSSDRITTSTDFAAYKATITKQATSYLSRAITQSATGQYLVEIMPNGRVPLAGLRTTLQSSYPAFNVQAVDQNYAGHGVIEGYVTLDDVPGIANTEGVGSVILELRPVHSSGAVTAQGVNQHRVNRVNSFYNPAISSNWDGTGMSIGQEAVPGTASVRTGA